jgi:exodeoxyribonuclease VII large subunit
MTRQPFDPSRIRAPEKRAPGALPPLTVSQVTNLVRQAMEDSIPPTIHVVGQISNYKRHTSGHAYFTLKDAFSELPCVMWRAEVARLKFTPTDGMETVATGNLEVFHRAGRYQLHVRRMEPRGVGALEVAFRQLHAKLQAEGLFDPKHKKPLPALPRRIAVVTSPTGAAIADILRTIARRFPCCTVVVYPVRVQGAGAGADVARAISRISDRAVDLGGVDLMIVGRGGGSLEDLWAFNEEVVARSIFASRIPIISAVGHEVDVTIADLVADVRAATPTAAAEIATPLRAELLASLTRQGARIAQSARRGLELSRLHVAGLLRLESWRTPLSMMRRREQWLDELAARVREALSRRLSAYRSRIHRAERVLPRIAPHSYLQRIGARFDTARRRLERALPARMRVAERRLEYVGRRLERCGPVGRLEVGAERFRRDALLLRAAMLRLMHGSTEQLTGRERVLAALSYHGTLHRGYTITRRKRAGRIVRSPAEVREGEVVTTETAEGTFDSRVIDARQMEMFD